MVTVIPRTYLPTRIIFIIPQSQVGENNCDDFLRLFVIFIHAFLPQFLFFKLTTYFIVRTYRITIFTSIVLEVSHMQRVFKRFQIAALQKLAPAFLNIIALIYCV